MAYSSTRFDFRDYGLLLVSIVVSLVLIFSNNNSQLETVKTWTLGGFGFVLQKLNVIKRLNASYEDNQWLRRRSAELMVENSRLKEALSENKRLRELLDFKSKSMSTLIAAKVIGKKNNGFVNSVLLTAGESDDVEKNMAVVTAQGLVGKIYYAGEHNSTAQLLLDRNFRVSAMTQRSRVMGIIKWTEGHQVRLAEVPKRLDVEVGDVVVTSGLSSIFPAGLEIGTVTSIDSDEQGMFAQISVEPSVDFTKLEEIFVVKNQQVYSATP